MFSPTQFSLRHRRRGISFLLRVCILAWSGILICQMVAQQTSTASLRHRGKGADQGDIVPVTERRSPSTLPQDASGEYLLGSDPGDVIQISLQPRQLTGYLSRRGESESDQGTPLTFFFSRTRLDGSRLGFTTQQVHGVWYSFDGTIARGTSRSKTEEGYYLLEGILVRNDVNNGKSERRMVNLKLARQS